VILFGNGRAYREAFSEKVAFSLTDRYRARLHIESVPESLTNLSWAPVTQKNTVRLNFKETVPVTTFTLSSGPAPQGH
jgi:hypothetical protein